jgi:hypothetical protein
VSEEQIQTLRGHLQNCVNHLERCNRRYRDDSVQNCIESVNKILYDSLRWDTDQRNDGWERRFKEFSHMHVDNGKDDTCAYCGFDIRHELHRPQPPKEEV